MPHLNSVSANNMWLEPPACAVARCGKQGAQFAAAGDAVGQTEFRRGCEARRPTDHGR